MNSGSTDWLKKFLDSGPEEPPAAAAAPGAEYPRRLGKYEVLSELGRGGTSIVYKATDPDLKRTVALKVLRDAVHPVLIERLHREATATARLRHPNIVSIHEVGSILGSNGGTIHFIAMDYVEGKNLAQATGDMTRRERLETLHAVAQTVAFAHDQGIIHRDLKPENILIEPATRVDATGLRWTVWLTDFGLAKIMGGEDLTRTGVTLGTPHYMSPEQVRGRSRETGPATDVWALGVMLYECLTGRRPFDGETALEVYEHIVHEEPVSPRKGQSRVSTDFETLVLKTLEKDPASRYPDARTFSEDLGRCLNDEPISTRPVGIARKSWRKLRKNPLPYALGFGMVAVLSVAVGLGLVGRADRKESLQAFRDKARIALDAALALRRAGANSRMREFLPPLEEAYGKTVARAPDLPEVDYLIGRMHRSLMQDEKALEYQEKALGKDPTYGPALYERAVLTFQKYSQEFDRSIDGGLILPEEMDLARPDLGRLRSTMTRDCAEVSAHPPEGAGPAQMLVARGILAYDRGQYPEARKVLEEAAKADPLLDEAWQVLAGTARVGSVFSVDQREKEYQAREDLYTEGLERDKGYIPYLILRARVRTTHAYYVADHGRDPLPEFAEAEEDLNQALGKDPSSLEGHLRRATCRVSRGIYRARSGSDPLPDFRLAEEDLTWIIERAPNPTAALAWTWRGNLRYQRGMVRIARSEDPLPDFALSERDFGAALKNGATDPEIAEASAKRGRLHAARAAYVSAHGGDPEGDFEAAERDFARPRNFPQEEPSYLTWSAMNHSARGAYRESRGGSPLSDYAKAEEDLNKAIRLQKDYTPAWKERARLRFARAAVWEKQREKERARQDCSASAQDWLEVLSLNPSLEFEVRNRLSDAQRKAAELGE